MDINPLHIFDYSHPITIETTLPPSVVRAAIADALHRPSLFSLISRPHTDILVGHISASSVTAARVRPFIGSIFKPYFHGHIVPSATHCKIQGQFRMSAFTRGLVLVTAGLFMLVATLFAIVWIIDPAERLLNPAIALLPLFTLAALLFATRAYHASDVQWITNKLKLALRT